MHLIIFKVIIAPIQSQIHYVHTVYAGSTEGAIGKGNIAEKIVIE